MEVDNLTSVQSALVSSTSSQEASTLSPRRPAFETQQAAEAQDRANEQKTDRKKLEDAVGTANELVQSFADRHLKFSIDQETEKLVVKVVDDKGDVIRQIPPKEMLNLIAHFDKIKALLFSAKY